MVENAFGILGVSRYYWILSGTTGLHGAKAKGG